MSTIVLGGGLSGLSAAYYLKKMLPKVPITLLEASDRIGGWVRSNKVDDCIFEEGPRTIRPRGSPAAFNTLELIDELGLANEIVPILSNHPAAKNRMIFVNGKLHSLPNSLISLFKKQEPFSKPLIRYLLNDLTAPKKNVKDEPIYDFVNRRFGSEFADYLISALICGICAGNAKEISVNFLMKNLFQYEQQYGNITKGMLKNLFDSNKVKPKGLALKAKKEKWSVYSFKNGLETLPKALENKLLDHKVEIYVNTTCKEIDLPCIDDNGLVFLADGRILNAFHVISTVSSQCLAKVVHKEHPQLADLLNKIKCVTVGVVNLKYNKRLITKDGFGFLVPPNEKLPILGVTYDSCCFPNGDNTVLTVMMGGAWFKDLFGDYPDKQDLLKTAKEQLKTTLGITDEPINFKVSIHQNCIPQYTVGHTETVEKINAYIKNNKLSLSLCGSSYYGVGINDVILSAKNAVNDLMEDV
ncbi:unnamed protein product [Acanthoscelides obtectus]|uniref:Protoporphyrinogen oxidase n=1 Tax=Acanthoscelides obtectus TaxID=200917 RepID=A0A9P0Q9G7_ACAOB|nr:unnamed protein product [Acanthoscelides obtectus]CAK1652824.1 Protoporphyrinogen oxidase [Acanthoscelides obtectus]